MNEYTLKINNQTVEGAEGETILNVCRKNAIDVPTLCHHDAVKPLGICGLCVVSVASKDDPGKVKYLRACITKASDGMVVETFDEEIFKKRGEVVKKYIASAPEDIELNALADMYEVDTDKIEPVEGAKDCIKCGLCVRTCNEIIGLDWKWKKGKDYPRDTAPPEGCIGCLTCANVCPTGCIDFDVREDTRTIWGQTFEMVKCGQCGAPVMTKAQREWLIKRDILPADYYDLCDVCKRAKVAAVQATLSEY